MSREACFLITQLVVHVFSQVLTTQNLAALGVTDGVSIILHERDLTTILHRLNQVLKPLDPALKVGKLYAALYKEIDNRVEVVAFYHEASTLPAAERNVKFVSACNCKFFYTKDSDERGIIDKPNCWVAIPTPESYYMTVPE